MVRQLLTALGWFTSIMIGMMLSFVAGYFKNEYWLGAIVVGLIVVFSVRTGRVLYRAANAEA